MKMNIIVEGSRGKSGVVEMLSSVLHTRGIKAIGKISGKVTRIFTNEGNIDIPRPGGRFFLDDENGNVLRNYPHMEHYIFENQALSDYTMQVVHKIINPELILIPNIRYEHQDRLGDTLEQQAKSFAWNFKGSKYVITTETKKEVLDIMIKYAIKYDVKLFISKKKETIPSEQTLILVDLALQFITGKGLNTEEYNNQIQKIYKNLSIRYSEDTKVNYFLGSKVNDVESTTNVFEYLKKQTEKNFVFVCYLRKDRNERSIAFEDHFFSKYYNDPRIDRIYFFGHKLKIVPNDCDKDFRISEDEYKKIYDYCNRNNLVLFTAINGVCPFIEMVQEELTGEKA